jgi:hypothetical protein
LKLYRGEHRSNLNVSPIALNADGGTRSGGASTAELVALTPFAQDPSLHVIEASTVKDFGKARDAPQHPLPPGLRTHKRLGANEAFDYKASQFEKEVRRAC